MKCVTTKHVYPYKGEVRNHETGELLATFELKTDVLIDEVRAGGRIPLIIGRGLTTKAREALGLPHSDVFRQAKDVAESDRGFSLAHVKHLVCRTVMCSVRRKMSLRAIAASRWRRKW